MDETLRDQFIYHIYPLGLCDAPATNDFSAPAQPRLEKLYPWLDHIQGLGATAVYLGPVFESSTHGYDTADYYAVDRRLGTRETLARLSAEIHRRGLRLILDAVLNHVGRDFWAFKDVRTRGGDSPYKGWFKGLRFTGSGPYGDPFVYEGWSGHLNLVKLDVENPDVRDHLLGAVRLWVEQCGVDGLRIDAADCIADSFLRELSTFCRKLRPDFFLLGEIVHGDYRRWANPETLDSVTNYECYKGLYSSLVDANYFEIAYALNRQFGAGGLYRDIPLYNFADNHDVDRVASSLTDLRHLYPLYCLLFTMPGIPSLYYGSEWGITGRKDGTDRQLRPALDLQAVVRGSPNKDLASAIARLAGVRRSRASLRYGDYTQLHVSARQLAFGRATDHERIVVALNADFVPASFDLELPHTGDGVLRDVLDPGDELTVRRGRTRVTVPPCWARVMSWSG